MEKNKITIVTPTYNRGYILNECYQSLEKQTNKSFSWLVIDDGSEDNTEELVNKWKEEGSISISYIKKKNGGKASCLNIAFDYVQTEYLTCLDSDDIFTPKAIENALDLLKQVKSLDDCGGVLALRTDSNHNVLGGKQIPEGIKFTTFPEIVNKFNIRSELICFYKTDIIKNYKFPEFEGEKFISPGFIDLEMSKRYKFLVSRKSFCICEYLMDGLTKNKTEVIKKNPKGYTSVIKKHFELATNLRSKSKNCLMYIAGSRLAKEKKIIRNSPNKVMTLFYYPLGVLAGWIRFK